MCNIPDIELKTIAEIKNMTAKKAVNIKIAPNKAVNITDSKFGGVPYWDMGIDYPKDCEGKLLMLLAQINLDKLNEEGMNPGNKLPKCGMLQFFISSTDDLSGANFDNEKTSDGKLKQDGFRVVYHKSINYNVSKDEILSIGMPLSTNADEELIPIWNEYGIDFEIKETYIGTDDYRFNKYLIEASQKAGWDIGECRNVYSLFSEEGYDLATEELGCTGHWMLGYPYFTQYDPREDDNFYNPQEDGLDEEEIAEYYARKLNKIYDIQLFQMDSDFGRDYDYIMWGDAGVANFFINEKDLENEDFTDILYYWDCC